MQEAHFTRGHLAFARAIDAGRLSWRQTGQRLGVTGDHVAKVLKGKTCGAETREMVAEVFGVAPALWRVDATDAERDECKRLVKEMEERRAKGKAS